VKKMDKAIKVPEIIKIASNDLKNLEEKDNKAVLKWLAICRHCKHDNRMTSGSVQQVVVDSTHTVLNTVI